MTSLYSRPMKYRCRTAIISEILLTAMGGATISKLISEAYLPSSRIGGYLSYLQENQMLVYNKKTQLYMTTENGIRFLHRYEEMNELFSQKENLNEQKILN
jgi:predicted transcriptional regulator